MSDFHSGFVVVLEKDLGEASSARVIAAILQLRGVISVKPVENGIDQSIATERARWDIEKRLLAALRA